MDALPYCDQLLLKDAMAEIANDESRCPTERKRARDLRDTIDRHITGSDE